MATKLWISAALGLLLSATALADEKPRSGDPIRGWGHWVDPDEDCAVEPTEVRLRIVVPAKAHDLSNELGLMNAPRVVRDVDGDFIAQVKVVGKVNPQGPSTIPVRPPFNGAGLFLAGNNGDFVRLERAAFERDGKVLTYLNYEQRDGDEHRNYGGVQLPNRDAYLRVERRGDELLSSVSLDGIRWTPLPVVVLRGDQKISIGLAAISTSSTPFTAEFEEFAIFARLPRFQSQKE